MKFATSMLPHLTDWELNIHIKISVERRTPKSLGVGVVNPRDLVLIRQS